MKKRIFKKGLACLVAVLLVMSMLQEVIWTNTLVYAGTEDVSEYSLQVGSAGDFNVSDGSLSAYAWAKRPLTGAEAITADEYYISFDYRTPKVEATSYVVYYGEQGGVQIGPRLQRRGTELRIIEPNGKTTYIGNFFTANKWMRFVVKYDKGIVSFYCNGNPIMSSGQAYAYTMADGSAKVDAIGPLGDTSSGWFDSYGDFDNFSVVQNGKVTMQEDFNSGLLPAELGWTAATSGKVGETVVADSISYTDGCPPVVLKSISAALTSASFKTGDRKKVSDIASVNGIMSDDTPVIMGMADIYATCPDAEAIDTSEHGYVTFLKAGDYTFKVVVEILGVQQSQDVTVNVGNGNSLQPGLPESLFGHATKALSGEEAITADDYYISFDYRNEEMRTNYNYYIWNAKYTDNTNAGINIYHRGTILRVNGKDMPDACDFSDWANLTFHFSNSELKMLYINGNPVNGFTPIALDSTKKLGFVGPLGDTSSSWTDGYAQIDNFSVIQNGIVTTCNNFDDGTTLSEFGWTCSANTGYANPPVNCSEPELVNVTAEASSSFCMVGTTQSVWEALNIRGTLNSGKPAVMGMSKITAISSNPEVIAVSGQSGIPQLEYLKNGTSEITVTCSLFGKEQTASVKLTVSDGNSVQAGTADSVCGYIYKTLSGNQIPASGSYFISFDYMPRSDKGSTYYDIWNSSNIGGVQTAPNIQQLNQDLRINLPVGGTKTVTNVLTYGKWHHFVLKYDGKQFCFFVNGEPILIGDSYTYMMNAEDMKTMKLGPIGDTSGTGANGYSYFDNFLVVENNNILYSENFNSNLALGQLGWTATGTVSYANPAKNSPLTVLNSIEIQENETVFSPGAEAKVTDVIYLTGVLSDGAKTVLGMGNILYSSSNEEVISVENRDGVTWLLFKNEGNAKLTVNCNLLGEEKSAVSDNIYVSSSMKVVAIGLATEERAVRPGSQLELTFRKIYDNGATSLVPVSKIMSFEVISANNGIIAVVQTADKVVLTPVSIGAAKITVKYSLDGNIKSFDIWFNVPGGSLQTGDGRGNCSGQVMRVLTGDEKITADEYFISFDYLYPEWTNMYNYYTWYSYDVEGLSGKVQYITPAILQTGSTLKLYLEGINAPVVLTDTLKSDVWHNFTFHFKGNMLSVYMDGEPVKLDKGEYWVARDSFKIPNLGWFGDTTGSDVSTGDAYYDNIKVIQMIDGGKVFTTNMNFNNKDTALAGLQVSGPAVGYTDKILDSAAGELESISLTGRTGFQPETEVVLSDVLSLNGILSNGSKAIMALGETVYTSSDTEVMEVIENDGVLSLVFKKNGSCMLTATHTQFGIEKSSQIDLIVSDTAIINQIELAMDRDYLVLGETLDTMLKTSDTFGNTSVANYKDIKDITGLKVESLNTSVLQVSNTEDGLSITGVSEGRAVVRLTYTYAGKPGIVDKLLEVVKIDSLEAMLTKTPVYVSDKFYVKLTAKLANGEALDDLKLDNMSYTFSQPSVVEEIEGQLCAKEACKGLAVDVNAEFGGKSYAAQFTMDISGLTPSKTKSTYYTEEKVQNALENIETYDWALSKRDAAIESADHFLDCFSYEELWTSLSSQGLPRSLAVNQAKGCPVCSTAINTYGNYPYKIDYDQLNWKMRCPNCGLAFTSADESIEFPTNNFKAYYLGGLNQYGEFDADLAKKHNDELIAAGGEGNLVNRYVKDGLSNVQIAKLKEIGISDEMIKRISTDSAWGVDDGWGYVDSESGEKYTFAAYYSHWFSWQDGPVKRGLSILKDAYLYTGEQKYADAAIIILDRMADIYPDMDVSVYRAQDGFQNGVNGQGKVENSVWECDNVNSFMLAFDAVFPAIPTMSLEVRDFLNSKSICQDKSNPDRIKLNFEDNVLRQVVPAFHNAQIHGNEGMHQYSIVLAAVILDSCPETQDWIYTAFATGGKYEAGNFYKLLVDSVDHDGQAYESPFYNAGWLSNWLGVANALAGYELPDGIPLKDGLISDPYQNVKFKQMFYGIYPLLLNQMYVANIGDSTQAGYPTTSVISKDELIKAFSKYGDIELAQVVYMLNGNSSVGIKEDLFTRNPEAIAEKIQTIIDENGTLNMDSVLMSGTGFAALRDGEAGELAAGSYIYPFMEMDVTEATAPVSSDYAPTLQFNATKKGDTLTISFDFDGDISKEYNLTIEKWATEWWGTYDVYLNDNQIPSMSFKGSGAVSESLGTIALLKGENRLRFVCTSDSSFKMGVRYMTITELEEGNQPEIKENTQRDLWMTFGKYEQHDHNDALNLGLVAYQLDLLPDLGYPRLADGGNERLHWVNSTLSHNTVTVDGLQQTPDYVGTPEHFDDTGFVKLIDVEAERDYSSTSTYKRTSAMIKVDDDSSYIVDLFRVSAGSKHEFSFHAAEGDVMTEGLTLAAQEGTYAGPGTVWGQMPAGDISTRNPGYYWLKNVEKDDEPSDKFSIDWSIKDTFGVYGNGVHADTDVHLKLTMLGDYGSVALADGVPPVKPGSAESYRYVVVKNEGGNLNSIFTSVIEPYKGNSNIASIEAVGVTENGNAVSTNEVRAIKVTLTNGRVDYIVNALNTAKTYHVADLFDFSGFFGVYTEENGVVTGRYLNNGTRIASLENTDAAVTGTVNSFTTELAENNYIQVALDQENVNISDLIGRYIYIENDRVKNAVYKIRNAEKKDDSSVNLYIGNVTAIRSWANASDFSQGYVYDMAIGQKFQIPLSVSEPPVFTKYHLTLAAGEGGTITKGTSGSYRAGDVILLEAEASNGYRFAGWKDSLNKGGFTDALAGTTSFTMPSEDVTITAIFEPILGNNFEGKEPAEPAAPIFTDIETHWAKNAIIKIVKAGLLKGYEDNTARPDNNATRAEYAALLVRMLGLETDKGANFSDVDANAWYIKPLAAAVDNGLIKGRPDGSFGPQDSITREEVMVMTSNVLKKLGVASATDEKVLDIFSDKDSISSWARKYVVNLVGLGIIKGSDSKINPKEKITRAEICVILDRIMSNYMGK